MFECSRYNYVNRKLCKQKVRKIDANEKIIIFLFDIQVIINSKVIIIKLIVIITM